MIAALEALSGRQDGGFTFVTPGEADDFVSWDRLRAEAADCAAKLRGRGLKAGDRLALITPKARDFIPAFLGAIWAGIVPAALNAPASFSKADSYLATVSAALQRIEPAYLLTTEAIADLVSRQSDAAKFLLGLISVESLRSEAATASLRDPAGRTDETIAFLQFTSGSTGFVKAVEVSHGGLRSNARAIMCDGLHSNSETDRGVSWLPLTHDMGLVGFVLSPIFNRVSVSFIPTTSFVRNPSIWLETLHRQRATISFAPNFAFALATKRATATQMSNWDLSCVRVLGCGAEPINPATMRAFVEKFAACGLKPNAILPSYGMAEATLAISFARSDEPLALDRVMRESLQDGGRAVRATSPSAAEACEIVSCGFALPGHELAVVDECGHRLGARQVGEFWFRGPSLARGYYRDPAASAQTFAGGWLRTGDLGYIAEDGRIFVTGRKKDLIIINGRNYDPQQIEWLLDGFPGVRDGSAVAFSVPGEATEELVVMVEARAGQSEPLQSMLRSRIANEFQFASAKVLLARPGSLPKTANGKRRRAAVRQKYLDELAESAH